MYLDTLGMINGYIDYISGELLSPQVAYNNTYGIQVYNETVYNQVLDTLNT